MNRRNKELSATSGEFSAAIKLLVDNQNKVFKRVFAGRSKQSRLVPHNDHDRHLLESAGYNSLRGNSQGGLESTSKRNILTSIQ